MEQPQVEVEVDRLNTSQDIPLVTIVLITSLNQHLTNHHNRGNNANLSSGYLPSYEEAIAMR